MGTSSSLPAVKTQLVSLLASALSTSGVSGGAVPVFYGWNPDVTDECVFLGRALLDPSDRDQIEVRYEYPTAELNRPVFELYDLPISVWSFRGDLSPGEADTAELRISALLDLVLATVADVDLGIASITNRPSSVLWRRVPFSSGWACFAVTETSIKATLT